MERLKDKPTYQRYHHLNRLKQELIEKGDHKYDELDKITKRFPSPELSRFENKSIKKVAAKAHSKMLNQIYNIHRIMANIRSPISHKSLLLRRIDSPT